MAPSEYYFFHPLVCRLPFVCCVFRDDVRGEWTIAMPIRPTLRGPVWLELRLLVCSGSQFTTMELDDIADVLGLEVLAGAVQHAPPSSATLAMAVGDEVGLRSSC